MFTDQERIQLCQEMREVIKVNGWYGIYDSEQKCAYTVGLRDTYKHPEIIVFGLSKENAFDAIEMAILTILDQDGSIKFNCPYTMLSKEFPSAVFLDASADMGPLYAPIAEIFYEATYFRVTQMLWSDKEGLFPYDLHCEVSAKEKQPILKLSFEENLD